MQYWYTIFTQLIHEFIHFYSFSLSRVNGAMTPAILFQLFLSIAYLSHRPQRCHKPSSSLFVSIGISWKGMPYITRTKFVVCFSLTEFLQHLNACTIRSFLFFCSVLNLFAGVSCRSLAGVLCAVVSFCGSFDCPVSVLLTFLPWIEILVFSCGYMRLQNVRFF